MYKKFEKESEEYQAFNDVWKFCQAYAIPEDTEEYWNGFVSDGEKIVSKYKSVKALKGIIMAISNANEEVLNTKKLKKIEE